MTEIETDVATTEESCQSVTKNVVVSPTAECIPTQSDSIVHIAKALCEMQKSNLGAVADSDNYFKQKYADLSSVWAVIRAPLTNAGLSIMQTIGTDDKNVIVTTTMFHISGEFICSSLATPIPSKAGVLNIQGMGSAITYLRRYALAALVGVCPVDDDAEMAMDRGVPVPKNTPSKKHANPVKKSAPKSAPPVEKDAIEVTGLPKGKGMLPLVFPSDLSEYNISDEYQINVKQLDAAGTHFDVNNTKVWTNRNGLYYSEMAGFSMTYGRVPTDVVDAVVRFGIDKVKTLHKKVDFMPYGGE